MNGQFKSKPFDIRFDFRDLHLIVFVQNEPLVWLGAQPPVLACHEVVREQKSWEVKGAYTPEIGPY